MSDIDFELFVGGVADFYGVEGHCFKFGNTVYKVTNDDGFATVSECHQVHRFPAQPLARVSVEYAPFDDEVYVLTDASDGHRWLCFGSETRDTSERSFDRIFTFDYTPKPQETTSENGGISALVEALRELVREEIAASRESLVSDVIKEIAKQSRLPKGK